VEAPGGAVGKVRGEVGRRQRRRTATRAAAGSAAAAAALVAAVVLAPGQVLPDPPPPAGGPSVAPSEGPAGALLEPDGLEGLRLGEPVGGLDPDYLRGDPDGCQWFEPLDRASVLGEAGAGATELTSGSRTT
jgi:hypothetical protein